MLYVWHKEAVGTLVVYAEAGNDEEARKRATVLAREHHVYTKFKKVLLTEPARHCNTPGVFIDESWMENL